MIENRKNYVTFILISTIHTHHLLPRRQPRARRAHRRLPWLHTQPCLLPSSTVSQKTQKAGQLADTSLICPTIIRSSLHLSQESPLLTDHAPYHFLLKLITSTLLLHKPPQTQPPSLPLQLQESAQRCLQTIRPTPRPRPENTETDGMLHTLILPPRTDQAAQTESWATIRLGKLSERGAWVK